MRDFIEIPFGVKDSELQEWVYTIPEGMTAEIKDGKVIIKRAESEDERIRKFLVSHVTEWIGCIEHDLKISSKDVELEKELEMFKAGLAWLEKHKESLHVSGTCKENPDSFTHVPENGETGTRNEPKPVEWSEEDEKMLDSIISGAQHHCYLTITDIGFLKSLPERFNLQPKQEWSDEDKVMIEFINLKLGQVDCLSDTVLSARAWLKSLKNRGNFPKSNTNPPSWSEEDDQLIGFIFDLLNDLVWRKDLAMSKEECLERLKSLRPQQKTEGIMGKSKEIPSNWKPSEEQMEALKAAMEHKVCYCGCNHGALKSLYNDLKKLKKCNMQLNEQNIPIDNNIKERKYIICCRKFDGVSAAACPCVGQIAVNSKLLAYLIYKLLDRWSRPTDGYKIAVMLLRRNNEGKYDAIERS